MTHLIRLVFHRAFICGACITIQAAILVGLIWKFDSYFAYVYWASMVISLSLVLWLVNNKANPSYKISWIITILLLPVFGMLFYFLVGRGRISQREKMRLSGLESDTVKFLDRRDDIVEEISQENLTAGNHSRYIADWAFYPPYRGTSSQYLPLGEDMFAQLKEELEKAQHYIFMEYFIIEGGKMWDSILEILVRKVKQGVDVRVIFDDMGCLLLLPYRYDKKLEALGIKSCIFNPLRPVLSTRFNNRDHRKICVIDGWVGFSGGINLADEYINEIVKHGHWKDTAVMLKGEAVWNLTIMFLTMWNYVRGTKEDYNQYRPHIYQPAPIPDDGYVQPFSDSPMDNESTGETIYLNLINRAQRYVYITTPYLIIDNEMITALSNAAKSGVDVRIITPHLGDKWFVHTTTRAYYQPLLDSGVKIYEYTPGFIHAKTYVVDDLYSVVGTINMDYRSLYLHFECGVWLYRTQSVLQVRDDFLRTLEDCERIDRDVWRKRPWYLHLAGAVLRLFAPLM